MTNKKAARAGTRTAINDAAFDIRDFTGADPMSITRQQKRSCWRKEGRR